MIFRVFLCQVLRNQRSPSRTNRHRILQLGIYELYSDRCSGESLMTSVDPSLVIFLLILNFVLLDDESLSLWAGYIAFSFVERY